MSENAAPVAFGIAGLGGWAVRIVDLLLSEGERPQPPVKLIAVCEPAQDLHAERIASLRARGVKVHRTIDELLAEPSLEAVWLPLPIHLHRPFTEQALAARKAVIVEKPAAGALDDVDAMIAARDRAGLPVAVGFQNLYDPATARLKQRLLAGDIGKPTSVTLIGCWPRGDAYYARNKWAGALKREGTWVLDSPANNALAHYVNLSLFLLGPDAPTSALPESVEAELYRARPIENYDTCSMRFTLPGGVPFVVLLTHAVSRLINPRVTITGTRGRVTVHLPERMVVEAGGKVEEVPLEADNYHHTPRNFARWVREGRRDGLSVATLENARAHSLAISAASQAAAVADVAPQYVDAVEGDAHGVLRTIRGIDTLFERCEASAKVLSELGDVPWAVKPGQLDLRGYRHFAGPKSA